MNAYATRQVAIVFDYCKDHIPGLTREVVHDFLSRAGWDKIEAIQTLLWANMPAETRADYDVVSHRQVKRYVVRCESEQQEQIVLQGQVVSPQDELEAAPSLETLAQVQRAMASMRMASGQERARLATLERVEGERADRTREALRKLQECVEAQSDAMPEGIYIELCNHVRSVFEASGCSSAQQLSAERAAAIQSAEEDDEDDDEDDGGDDEIPGVLVDEPEELLSDAEIAALHSSPVSIQYGRRTYLVPQEPHMLGNELLQPVGIGSIRQLVRRDMANMPRLVSEHGAENLVIFRAPGSPDLVGVAPSSRGQQREGVVIGHDTSRVPVLLESDIGDSRARAEFDVWPGESWTDRNIRVANDRRIADDRDTSR